VTKGKNSHKVLNRPGTPISPGNRAPEGSAKTRYDYVQDLWSGEILLGQNVKMQIEISHM
jgi:hypothetical protein